MRLSLLLCLLLVAVPIAVATMLIIRRLPELRREEEAQQKTFRAAAARVYQAHVVPSNDPRFSFDPATATVVHEYEAFGRKRHPGHWFYWMERIARNPSGEYFRIEYGTGSISRFSHIEHRIAKIVLKDRYQPPESA
ncbi:hypothetical protein ACQ86G_24915 [Roseateles chitinivorans]|uniref:hypothetical protein n=1 Tax=Roseateles chitinivorans TaxID=2917965 RepID=UPI003D6665D5